MTTETPPTATQITTARARAAEINVELRESNTHEGDPFRTTRLAELERLRPIAYADVAPPSTPSGPSVTERLDAREESRRLTKVLSDLPQGHPDENDIRLRLVELAGVANAPAIAAAAQSNPVTSMLPPSLRAEPWVGELATTAERLGIVGWASLVHLAAGELAEGHVGISDEDAIATLHARHGEERGDEIVAAAQEAAKHLPRRFRVFLAERRLLANPVLVEALAAAWRRRGGREENA